MQAAAIITAIRDGSRLRRCVSTLKAQHPDIQIHIGAQGKLDPDISDLESLPRVTVHHLPFDYGLSASRNYLVRQVAEPFIFVCDDDFVFDDRLGLNRALSFFDAMPDLGVVGGRLFTTTYDPNGKVLAQGEQRFANMLVYDRDSRTLVMLPASIAGARREGQLLFCDTVLHFCLIRRSAVFDRGIFYDESTKIGGEHFEFFLRLK